VCSASPSWSLCVLCFSLLISLFTNLLPPCDALIY
jgi:hypothetical protein